MPKPAGMAQRYMPGLDGLRAFAVLAVIAYHLQLGWAPGGLLGVGVFFTLSGYLITDLLLGQWEDLGTLRLGDFWLRRARRLLPALFVMLAVVVIWAALLDRSQLPSLREYVLAAALYVSNWWSIVRHASYFARFGPPPPLDHLWSLAVEEQFYLLWPWVLWFGLRCVRGRIRMAGLTLALAVLSAVVAALVYQPGYDPTRVYEGTDTRAFGLLIGAALAMVWPSRHLRPDLGRWRRGLLDGVGLAGLVIIALLIWRTNQYSATLYNGGLVLLSVATALVVAALAHPASLMGRVMGFEPLRWLGVRSYGIYLWHFPIIVLITPPLAKVDPPLAALQVAATIAVAALSWRLVEEPIRRGALGRFWAQVRAGRWQVVPGRSRVAVLVTLSTMALAGCGLSGVSINLPARSSQVSAASSRELPSTSGSMAKLTMGGASINASGSNPQPSSRGRRTASGPHTWCHSVVYIGDSTSEGMIQPSYLPNPAQRIGARLAQVGATKQHIEISGARSIVETLSGQTNAYDVARHLVASGFRGCWILALGTNDTANVYVGSPVGRLTRIKRMMSVIGKQAVLWVNLKSLVGSGAYSETDMQLWDHTLLQACSQYGNMRIFNWAAVVQNGWFINDGIHYTSGGYAQRARLIAAALAQAFPASGKHWHRGCLVS